jgi:5-methylcytosine-specific restriction protein A
VLRDRAAFIKKRLGDFADLLSIKEIDLGSNARLPGDYAAGHPLGFTYDGARLPPEADLRTDLRTIVSAYRALTFRGGLHPSAGDEGLDADDVAATLSQQHYCGFHGPQWSD